MVDAKSCYLKKIISVCLLFKNNIVILKLLMLADWNLYILFYFWERVEICTNRIVFILVWLMLNDWSSFFIIYYYCMTRLKCILFFVYNCVRSSFRIWRNNFFALNGIALRCDNIYYYYYFLSLYILLLVILLSMLWI